jgi:hypothetical protein
MHIDKILALALPLALAAGLSVSAKQHDHKESAEMGREAGGRFQPQMFGWMVHVYPFESTTDRFWRR